MAEENKVVVEKKEVVKESTQTTNPRGRKGIVWTLALSLLSGLVFGLAFMLYSANNTANYYASSLESNYQKSYYDLVDKVNNMEVKLSKVVSSNDNVYSEKVLNEISKNCEDAQNNLNMLPINMAGVEESLKFINQLGGYCQTLANKLGKGGSLTPQEKLTLVQLHRSVKNMCNSFEGMNQSMANGYSIINQGLKVEGDYNDITLSLQSMKEKDVEYPTMIYDGPFADSQILKEVKGLKAQTEVSKDQARASLSKIFDVKETDIKFETEANSNFTTYDFSFKKDKISFYAQITKKGGFLLTVSSYNDTRAININREEASVLAKDFVEKVNLKNLEIVWSDVVGQDAYFNFAPVVDGVIIYPDLAKVKVDLASKQVIGFEATSYYTNHIDRTLGSFAISSAQAKQVISGDYAISTIKKALSPIDFNEVLTWEIKAIKEGSIYYFYVDAQSGQLVNILKVIYTQDGSKLM